MIPLISISIGFCLGCIPAAKTTQILTIALSALEGSIV